jgi:hypothetical protein
MPRDASSSAATSDARSVIGEADEPLRGGRQTEGEQQHLSCGKPAQQANRRPADWYHGPFVETPNGDLDQGDSAAVEDDVAEVPETPWDEPLDELVDRADQDPDQDCGDVDGWIRNALCEDGVEEDAEDSVLEKVNRLLRLTHEAVGPSDGDRRHRGEPCNVGEADLRPSPLQVCNGGGRCADHEDDDRIADKLGGPAGGKGLPHAPDERD